MVTWLSPFEMKEGGEREEGERTLASLRDDRIS
jgi:hypothetical protein